MRYIVRSVHAPSFEVSWVAKDAAQLRAGMPSANHKGLMPMSDAEVAQFRFMERDGKSEVRTERTVFLRQA